MRRIFVALVTGGQGGSKLSLWNVLPGPRVKG